MIGSASTKTLPLVQNRIQIYQNESPDKLNEDQKRLLKTLPVLEAVSKELEEVRKAIEVRSCAACTFSHRVHIDSAV